MKSNKLTRASVRHTALGAMVIGGLVAVQPAVAKDHTPHVGSVFIIAMENHNFTQPPSQTSPQPIFGNPAAPYMNGLITTGDPRAAQVSFATAYFNSGTGVHPSEPNYVWAEAGSDFGAHTDADPAAANGNTFYDNLNPNVTLLNEDGTTAVLAPLGSPFVRVVVGEDDVLRPNETKFVKLEFQNPSNAAITYSPRLLNVTPAP